MVHLKCHTGVTNFVMQRMKWLAESQKIWVRVWTESTFANVVIFCLVRENYERLDLKILSVTCDLMVEW